MISADEAFLKSTAQPNNEVSKSQNQSYANTGSIFPVQREDLIIHPSSFEQTLKEADNLIQYIKAKFIEFRLDEAYRKMRECQALGNNLNNEEKIRFEDFLSKEQSLFDTITTEYDYLDEICKELHTDEGWNTDNSGEDFRVMYKKVPNTNIITVRMESEIEIPLFNIITLVNEIDLWHLWVAFIKETAEIKEIHKGAKVYYIEFGLPYPLANRDLHVFGSGVNRLDENGTVMIMAKTVDNNAEFLAKNNVQKREKPGSAQIEIKLGGFEVTAINPGKSKFKGIANVNPNFTWLPDSLINLVLRKAVKFIFNRMLSKAKVFEGSPWEKEAQKEEKQDFYGWLKRDIEAFFERRQQNEKKDL